MLIRSNTSALLLATATLLLMGSVRVLAQLPTDCLKTVASTFCLGGSLQDVPLQPVEQMPHDQAPDTLVSHYSSADLQWRVHSIDDQITQISRIEKPGDWLAYTNWKKRIIRQYGRGEDRSTLPAYATSRSSRRNAINSKRGHAAMQWARQGWRLELIWDNTQHIEIRYSLGVESTESPTTEDL